MGKKGSVTNHKIYLDRFFCYIKMFKSKFVGSVIYSTLDVFFDLLPDIVLGLAIDSLIEHKNSKLGKLGFTQVQYQLFIVVFIIVIVYGLQAFCQYQYSIKWSKFSFSLQHILRSNLLEKILNSKIKSFFEKDSGDMIAIGMEDITSIGSFFEDAISSIVKLIATCIFVFIYIFIVSYKLSLILLFSLLVLLLLSLFIHKKVRGLYTEVFKKAGQISVNFTNGILGFLSIKSLLAQKIEINKLIVNSSDYTESSNLSRKKTAIICPIVNLCIVVSCAMTILYGGKMVLTKTLDIGTYSSLVILIPTTMVPFTDLFFIMASIEKLFSCVARVMNLMALEQEPSGGINHNFGGRIDIKNVWFNYHDNNYVLKNLDCQIQPNQSVAFVGSTGSGKSTITKLLTSMYSPSLGNISYDFVDIKNISIDSVRANVCLVQQFPFIFEATIADNISYGLNDISQNQIEDVAKKVNLHDYIVSLKCGYNTFLSKKKHVLSGGQSQLIAIARAIIRNPKVFILDEFTSALDIETEKSIQKAMNFLTKETTKIVIAHKLTTIKDFDVIFVLDQGEIVEKGSHEELIQYGGVYNRMWSNYLS